MPGRPCGGQRTICGGSSLLLPYEFQGRSPDCKAGGSSPSLELAGSHMEF